MRSSGRGTFRLFLAFLCTGWYDERMKKRVAYYVSRKNPLIWLAALVMLASAALRIANVCGKGADARTMWLLVVLPVTACVFYVLNILCNGKDRFYRSSVPVFLLAIYYGIKVTLVSPYLWLTFVFWIAYLAIAAFYAVTVSGHVKSTIPLLLLLLAAFAVLAAMHEKEFSRENWDQLRQILPEEKLIYFGDTARVPYGGRSKETLLKYARQDVRFLRSFDLKAIVIACGTVSTTSLDTLQAENDLPIVGVVEPTCRRALLVTKNKKVGIIATLASIRSGAYEAMLRRLDPAVEIIGKPCPLFVPLVENGRISRGDVVIETVAREYLEPLKATGVDTLILGCTHYPLLTEIIGDIMGPEVTLVSAGEESAFELKRLLKAGSLRADEGQTGGVDFYVSDRPEDFEKIASVFLGTELSHGAERINIEQY